ncbi:MAG: cation transporter [Planctomycetes bacterium]|nr:cation transporter [Planctomycetota bacterium]
MKELTRRIAARTIRDYEKTENLKVRARYGMLEGWVSIVVNILLFIIKSAIGLLIGSVSLIADAVHTLSDCVTSVVVIIGFKIARQPSDKEHPFGHGRMEAIAAIIISVLLIVAGIELLKSSVNRLLHPTHVDAGVALILVLIGTLLSKEMLAQFAKHLGEMIDSKTLAADFWHHRTDVIATGLVIVALIASDLGYPWFDGLAGVLVSLIVAYTGFLITKDAISPLLGAAPPPELLKQIEQTARNIEGVHGVHDVIVHQYGMTNLVSLHIEVDAEKDVTALHELSEEVEAAVGGDLHGTVVVHIDPLNKDHERYDDVEQAVREIVEGHEQITSFHDLRIVGHGLKARLVFDLTVTDDADEHDIYDIKQDVAAQMKQRFPGFDAVVQVDPRFSYNVPKGK